MGTNFYQMTNEESRCECCGHTKEGERLHIGKSSMGWAFAFELHPNESINSHADWVARLSEPNVIIVDEYGEKWSSEKFLSFIQGKKGASEWGRVPHGYIDWQEFHQRNYSKRGPNNLLFSTWQVVEEGDTWQCRIGEFC